MLPKFIYTFLIVNEIHKFKYNRSFTNQKKNRNVGRYILLGIIEKRKKKKKKSPRTIISIKKIEKGESIQKTAANYSSIANVHFKHRKARHGTLKSLHGNCLVETTGK